MSIARRGRMTPAGKWRSHTLCGLFALGFGRTGRLSASRPLILAAAILLGVSACATPPPPPVQPTAQPRFVAIAPSLPQTGWQCVPYVRQVSAFDIRGDAWTWWSAAAGRYDRGTRPAPGAVLVLRQTDKLRYGHVALVRQILGPREIVVDHANWGWDAATRGRIDAGMRVKDVSPGNDWSQTHFWYDPSDSYGITNYPAYGFIYPRLSGPTGPLSASR